MLFVTDLLLSNITSSTEAKIDATHPKDLMRKASLFGVVNYSKEWLAGWYCLENLGASHIQTTIFNRSMFTLRMKILVEILGGHSECSEDYDDHDDGSGSDVI